jgi:hypothetical protein
MELAFELVPAVLAGLIAGAIMEGPVYMQKAMGLNVKQNIFRTWGNLLRVPGGTGKYLAGFLFHEGVAVFAAVLYAFFFDFVDAGGSLLLWGLVGALIHYALAGPIVAVLPSLDPETGVVGGQGLAYKNYGILDVGTSFFGHMMFGLSTAILYGLLHTDGGSNLLF